MGRNEDYGNPSTTFGGPPPFHKGDFVEKKTAVPRPLHKGSIRCRARKFGDRKNCADRKKIPITRKTPFGVFPPVFLSGNTVFLF